MEKKFSKKVVYGTNKKNIKIISVYKKNYKKNS